MVHYLSPSLTSHISQGSHSLPQFTVFTLTHSLSSQCSHSLSSQSHTPSAHTHSLPQFTLTHSLSSHSLPQFTVFTLTPSAHTHTLPQFTYRVHTLTHTLPTVQLEVTQMQAPLQAVSRKPSSMPSREDNSRKCVVQDTDHFYMYILSITVVYFSIFVHIIVSSIPYCAVVHPFFLCVL